MVRSLELTAVLALDVSRGLQRVMGAAHVTARLGGLFLRYSHGTILIVGPWVGLMRDDRRPSLPENPGRGMPPPVNTCSEPPEGPLKYPIRPVTASHTRRQGFFISPFNAPKGDSGLF